MLLRCYLFIFFFFFQAEDGIRDGHVTGVQTCALPIYIRQLLFVPAPTLLWDDKELPNVPLSQINIVDGRPTPRSEERRVRKECRSRWSPYHEKKKDMIKN